MMFKKTIFPIIIVIGLLIINSCSDDKTKNQKHNYVSKIYNFDNVDMNEFVGDGFTPDEYKEVLEKNKNIPDTDEYNKAIIVVLGQEVSKREFECQKNILRLRNHSISNKAIVYSIVKNIVLENEVEKLNIIPEETDWVNEYADTIKKSFESETSMEYENLYMEYKGYTKEEFIKESAENAYNLLRYEELYNTINKNGKYKSVDDYVKDLIKKADMKIYDSKLDEECKK